ncbi:hypothetical protein Anamo_1705 [Acetomicrobium mobile DSM 13181]|uniref:Uncharacterized protein n=1 Tax=Acetomicrobium mobile (strain ATCC BAA-54 / DSM 13181 / JCM 12221 / NGA) TaxID=891968 RepID=I4BYE0_ACEMN|nr:hypothetical protein [Acetomicrobium mobile]AFM22297.1 hypothetical protein Anamo_1705 [Acetomicrobium mobile DSM 13181]
MKFIWIFCNQSIAPEVLELLDSLEVDGIPFGGMCWAIIVAAVPIGEMRFGPGRIGQYWSLIAQARRGTLSKSYER